MTLLYADCGSRFFVVHNTEKTSYERAQSTAGTHTYRMHNNNNQIYTFCIVVAACVSAACSNGFTVRVEAVENTTLAVSARRSHHRVESVGILSRKECWVDRRRSLSNFSPIQWNLPLNGQLINLSHGLKFIPIFLHVSTARFLRIRLAIQRVFRNYSCNNTPSTDLKRYYVQNTIMSTPVNNFVAFRVERRTTLERFTRDYPQYTS